MSEQIRRESPLIRFKPAERATRQPAASAGVLVGERPFLGYLNLRGNPADSALLKAASGVLGFDLPVEVNTATEGDGRVAYWLGPDEWLVVTPGDQTNDVAERLRSAFGEVFTNVTDVSGGQTIVTLTGSHARDLPAKGCPLDLHPSVFGPGQCAQSLFAKSPILIRLVDDSPAFEIVLRRSFADYFWHWMEDAAQEYGLTIVATPEL